MIKEIALSILLVKNPFMSYSSQVHALKSATAIIEQQAGVKLVVKRIRKSKDLYKDTNDLTHRAEHFAQWQGYLLRNRFYDQTAINFIIDSPIIDNGVRYVAGLGHVCRPRGGFAIAQIHSVGSNGLDRTQQSVITLIHELSHPIGAYTLYEGNGYENIGAAGLSPLPTNYDELSIKQIEQCLNF